MKLLRSQNGVPSWATTLAVPALIVLTLRYLAGGHEVAVGGAVIKVAFMSGTDYLAVTTPVVGLARVEQVGGR